METNARTAHLSCKLCILADNLFWMYLLRVHWKGKVRNRGAKRVLAGIFVICCSRGVEPLCVFLLCWTS